MITVEATIYSSHMHVVFLYPDKQQKEIDLPGDNPVILRGRAERMMYNEARLYILIKLSGWLRQRMFWFNKINWNKSAGDCAKILVMMGYYEVRGFFQLCDRLADIRSTIEALAPLDGSGYYNNTILPILDYCTKMKEGLI